MHVWFHHAHLYSSSPAVLSVSTLTAIIQWHPALLCIVCGWDLILPVLKYLQMCHGPRQQSRTLPLNTFRTLHRATVTQPLLYLLPSTLPIIPQILIVSCKNLVSASSQNWFCLYSILDYYSPHMSSLYERAERESRAFLNSLNHS